MRVTAPAPARRPPSPPAIARPRPLHAAPPASRGSWVKRWFGRREPTAYQRCLAIHIHFAGPRSALY